MFCKYSSLRTKTDNLSSSLSTTITTTQKLEEISYQPVNIAVRTKLIKHGKTIEEL